MLNICSKEHDEIVYEGHTCPLCIALGDLKLAQHERNLMEGERDKLMATVEKMLGR